MDIEQAAFVATDKTRCQDAHEAGEHNEIRRKLVDAFGQCGVEGFATGEALVVDEMGGNTGPLGSFETERLRAVADHGGDIDRQRAGVAGGDQRLHVGTATGDQDDDILHFKKI